MQLVVLHEIDFNLALSNSQFKTKRVSLFYWNVVSDNADYYLCSKYSVGKSRFTERETKTLTVFTGALDRSIDRSAIGRAANSYIWKISAPKTKSMSSCCLIERIYKQDFAWIIFFLERFTKWIHFALDIFFHNGCQVRNIIVCEVWWHLYLINERPTFCPY